jgi:hypothetical protein
MAELAKRRARYRGRGKAGVIRGFVREDDAAVMIEAGFVLLPTMALVFGLVEFAVVMMIGSSLNFAVAAAAEKARGAPVNGPVMVRDVLATARENMLPFASSCIELETTEYATLEDFGADSSKTQLTTETELVGTSGREIGEFSFTCDWSFMTPLIAQMAGRSITFNGTTVVRYES